MSVGAQRKASAALVLAFEMRSTEGASYEKSTAAGATPVLAWPPTTAVTASRKPKPTGMAKTMAVWLCEIMAACGTVTFVAIVPGCVGMSTSEPERPRLAPSTVTLMAAPEAASRPEVGPEAGRMAVTLGGAYV